MARIIKPDRQRNNSTTLPTSLDTSFLEQRKNRQKEILKENEKLLKKLQDSRSSYDIMKWEQDRLSQIKYVNRISKYDYALIPKKRGKSLQQKLGHLITEKTSRYDEDY